MKTLVISRSGQTQRGIQQVWSLDAVTYNSLQALQMIARPCAAGSANRSAFPFLDHSCIELISIYHEPLVSSFGDQIQLVIGFYRKY